MRTKKFLGVISAGRLVLYRECKPPSHEKVFDTMIPLCGSNVNVKIKPDDKHDKRFTINVETYNEGKRKEDTYEVIFSIVWFVNF